MTAWATTVEWFGQETGKTGLTGWATKMMSGVSIQGDVYGFLCQEMRSSRRALISSEIDGLGTELTVGPNSR